MKRVFLGLLVVLVVALGCFYLFIPNIVTVNQQVVITANPQGLYRDLQNSTSWLAWWPGEKDSVRNRLLFRGNAYAVTDQTLTSFIIAITGKNIAVNTSLFLLAATLDTTQLSWQARLPMAASPVARVQRYQSSKQLRNDLDTLLKIMQAYYSKTENLYRIPVGKELIKDSLLVFTSATSKGYPSTSFIYGLIGKLKTFAASQSANETGFPMLNVSTSDSVTFLTKVSLPVNKLTQPSGAFTLRRMPGRFPILVTQVNGGPAQIAQAQQQMQNYLDDYKRTAVAIPFQSLITNRLQEPDTAKWITKLYFPVIEYPKP